MGRIIEVRTTKSKEQAIADARRALADNGIDCWVAMDGGSFKGRGFSGEFRIVGDLATVEIGEKPMLVPWSMVESQIKSFFA